MIPCLDYIVLEKEDAGEKKFEEGRVYEFMLKNHSDFSCIGRETDLWTKNGGYGMKKVGRICLFEVLHFPELTTGKVYTKIKFRMNKLKGETPLIRKRED